MILFSFMMIENGSRAENGCKQDRVSQQGFAHGSSSLPSMPSASDGLFIGCPKPHKMTTICTGHGWPDLSSSCLNWKSVIAVIPWSFVP